MDFDIPADHRVKLKESEKRDEYIDVAREVKKLWNMKVTMISVVTGAPGTVIKWLVQGLKELEIRTRMLRSTRIIIKYINIYIHVCVREQGVYI